MVRSKILVKYSANAAAIELRMRFWSFRRNSGGIVRSPSFAHSRVVPHPGAPAGGLMKNQPVLEMILRYCTCRFYGPKGDAFKRLSRCLSTTYYIPLPPCGPRALLCGLGRRVLCSPHKKQSRNESIGYRCSPSSHPTDVV